MNVIKKRKKKCWEFGRRLCEDLVGRSQSVYQESVFIQSICTFSGHQRHMKSEINSGNWRGVRALLTGWSVLQLNLKPQARALIPSIAYPDAVTSETWESFRRTFQGQGKAFKQCQQFLLKGLSKRIVIYKLELGTHGANSCKASVPLAW